MNDVIATDEFAGWYASLDERDGDDVLNVVTKLEAMGLQLGAPHCSAIAGASFGLRELRPRSGASPLRIFYAYDAARDAVLILGGDKSGDPKFYNRMIVKCEAVWRQYREEQEG